MLDVKSNAAPFEYKRVDNHGAQIEDEVNRLTNDGWTFIAGYEKENSEVVWMVRQK